MRVRYYMYEFYKLNGGGFGFTIPDQFAPGKGERMPSYITLINDYLHPYVQSYEKEIMGVKVSSTVIERWNKKRLLDAIFSNLNLE